MISKNLFVYLSIIACFYLEAQSPNEVYLDYLKEEFEEGSEDFDKFSEQHLQALANGTIDGEAAFKVATYFTNLVTRAGYMKEGGDDLKEVIAESLIFAVVAGNKEAIPELASMYLLGWHVDQNFDAFDKYMRLAAEEDLLRGHAYIGKYYEIGDSKQKKIDALPSLKIAAERQDPASMLILGKAYLNKDVGIKSKDPVKGLNLIKQASASGHQESKNELCGILIFNEDIRDLNAAIGHCPATASKGDRWSQLALMYAYMLSDNNVLCYAWAEIGLANKDFPQAAEMFNQQFKETKSLCRESMTKSQVRRANDLIKKLTIN